VKQITAISATFQVKVETTTWVDKSQKMQVLAGNTQCNASVQHYTMIDHRNSSDCRCNKN